MSNVLGDRLKRLRTESGLTQLELSSKLNIGNTTLSQYESGQRIPNDQIKTDICRYFGISMDYLLGLSDVRERDQRGPEIGCNDIPGYSKLNDSNKAAIDQLVDNLLKSQSDKEN